ncbi:hypothetical protein KEG38_29675 [Polyangium jinanense]|uniref:hypothetical protein n=1 Tax=Polyangium jinanense TaxID=2829994 RepID=UPI0023426F66|nr:hypothetical protein [Polyangium jinanense]MDC3958064.1 hypothetical protein [Polyangium jinanense]
MGRIRVTSEVWKGVALGVATLVAYLVFYALWTFSYGDTVGADRAEHQQTVSFLGRILLAALLPAALVGGLLGALARDLRKARTLTLAGAAVFGYFGVMAVTFALLFLWEGEPLQGAWFGFVLGLVLTPSLAPFALVAAVILERWTRPGRPRGARG